MNATDSTVDSAVVVGAPLADVRRVLQAKHGQRRRLRLGDHAVLRPGVPQ